MKFNRINKLLSLITKVRTPALNYLKDGVAEKEIKDFEEKFMVTLPDLIKSLYLRYDGTDYIYEKSIGELCLFPGRIFLALSDLEKTYLDGLKDDLWPEKLLPIFDNGNLELLLFDCNINSPDYGKIFYFSLSDPLIEDIISYCDSFDSMVDAYIECYENNVYMLNDESNYIETVKITFHNKTFKKYNPNSDYWMIPGMVI